MGGESNFNNRQILEKQRGLTQHMGLQINEGWDPYPVGHAGAIIGSLWSTADNNQKYIADVNPRTGARNFGTTNGTNSLMVRAINFGINDNCYFGLAVRYTDYTNATPANCTGTRVGWGIGQSNGIDKSTRLQLCICGPNGEHALSYNGAILVSSGPLAIGSYHYHVVYFNNATGAYAYWVDRNLVGVGNIGVSNIIVGEFQFGRLPGNGFSDADDLFFFSNPTASESAIISSVLDFSVIYALPVANGPVQDWSHSGGGSAYEDIDEQPYNTGDYIEAATVGDVSTFALEDKSAGVFQVLGITTLSYERKESAGAGSVLQSIIANGANGAGTNSPLSTTEAFYQDASNDSINPFTGTNWVPSDLSTLGLRYVRTA